jgi:hypothetical protein
MGKLLLIAIALGLGVALAKVTIFAPTKPQAVAAPVDPLADQAARLAAERERLHAEDVARAKNWQPHLESAAPPRGQARPQTRQHAAGGPAAAGARPSGAVPQSCEQARNNVNVTSDWMRQGGQVRDTGTNKRLSENETFDAASRNRQYVEDNCRGR